MTAVESSGPGLPVSAVARRLGVAPATLRTWALRYGLGPSAHQAGAHRRYSAQDLSRLELMRRLTLEGVPPAEAAQAALSGPSGDRTDRTEAAQAALSGPSGDRTDRTEPPGRSRRPGRSRGGPGGRVLALPGAEEVARGLGRAAMALDSRTVTGMLRRELAAHGVLATWENVVAPVLVAVGERWAATGEGVEVEHLLADCVGVALREVAEGGHEPLGGRPVLLACAPGDQHVLALYALAAALAERGVGARILGPALPADALEAAVRRTGPALLFLWSQLPTTADPSILADLPTLRPPTAVVVGGPGWQPGSLPERVGVASGLLSALELVLPAIGR